MSDPTSGGDLPGGSSGDRFGGGKGPGGGGRSGGAAGGDVPKGIAATLAEVSDRATLLVREEIELAKAEVAEKATKLLKGAVIGVAAGVFVLTALFFVLVGCAWLLYYYLPIGNQFTYFWGFFAMALILLILGLIAGLLAARAVKRGAPPTPEMAIEEARLIRDTVSSPGTEAPRDAYSQAAASATTGQGAADAHTAAGGLGAGGAPGAGVPRAPYGAASAHSARPPVAGDEGGVA